MARLNLLPFLLALVSVPVVAQDGNPSGVATGTTAADTAADAADDLTRPPQIDPDAAPGEAPPIEPETEENDGILEALVTRGQTDWRLPDLGTSLRPDEDTLEPGQRIAVNWLPLYDPENQDPVENLFRDYEDTRNVGFLRIFDIRFGERSEPNEPTE